jgi:hypothetical protein
MTHHIEAATVNHNTSSYVELMLRSLFARHSPDLELSIMVFDNASEDDTTGLCAYAEKMGVPIVQSGLTTQTQNNSHGEILRRFVLEHPDCTHYLFLDADVCFVQDNTIHVMLEELEACDDAFGIGPKLSWDGVNELSEEALRNPDLYEARLHPCCALVKNTDLFRRVVEEVGLSCVKYLWAEGEEYLDTFRLMTKVMKTHSLRHLISSRMVIHFFCVSYEWDPPHFMQEKAQRRDELLRKFRGEEKRRAIA